MRRYWVDRWIIRRSADRLLNNGIPVRTRNGAEHLFRTRGYRVCLLLHVHQGHFRRMALSVYGGNRHFEIVVTSPGTWRVCIQLGAVMEQCVIDDRIGWALRNREYWDFQKLWDIDPRRNTYYALELPWANSFCIPRSAPTATLATLIFSRRKSSFGYLPRYLGM